jgi:prevent-host-death family protein
MEVNVHHAKTNLSKLILRAEAGEEIVIARAGKPVVKLVRVEDAPRKLYKPGALKGRLELPEDFLDNPEIDKQIEKLFNDSPILSIDASGSRLRKRSRKA